VDWGALPTQFLKRLPVPVLHCETIEEGLQIDWPKNSSKMPTDAFHHDGTLTGGYRCSQGSGGIGFFLLVSFGVVAYLMHENWITDNSTVLGLLFGKSVFSIATTARGTNIWRNEVNKGASLDALLLCPY
jgi:hypothetical protein